MLDPQDAQHGMHTVRPPRQAGVGHLGCCPCDGQDGDDGYVPHGSLVHEVDGAELTHGWKAGGIGGRGTKSFRKRHIIFPPPFEIRVAHRAVRKLGYLSPLSNTSSVIKRVVRKLGRREASGGSKTKSFRNTSSVIKKVSG